MRFHIKTGDRQTHRHTDTQNLWNLEVLTHLKIENNLRAMKRILYDMGLLTLVRWLLQIALDQDLS